MRANFAMSVLPVVGELTCPKPGANLQECIRSDR